MKEIDYLYYKCKIYNEYIYEKVFKGLPGTENIYKKIFNDIEKSYRENKVNYFIKLSKQIDSQIIEFSSDFKIYEVEEIFKKETGMDSGNLFKPNDKKKIKSIIKRGEVKNNNEYIFINEYLNNVDDFEKDIVEELNKLLLEYLKK
jgi:hypothetical protein